MRTEHVLGLSTAGALVLSLLWRRKQRCADGAAADDAGQLAPFHLERYFARYEFSAEHLMCCSDIEAMTVPELLALADADSARRWAELSLGYTESWGLPALREAVADLYAPVIEARHTIVLAPEEGIYLAMRALLRAGDHVVVTAPCYQSLAEVARAVGCEVSFWRPSRRAGRPHAHGSNGQLHFDVAELRRLVRPNTKLVTVNFPHNPTGCLPTRPEWKAIVDVARGCGGDGAYLFSDEMYRLVEKCAAAEGGKLDGCDARLPSACELYEKAVVLAGMSKVFACPGLRVGWLASRCAKLLQRVLELKDFTTICPSAPSEVLALMALRAREPVLARNRAIVRENMALAVAFFARHADKFSFEPPTAGPIGLPKLVAPIACEWDEHGRPLPGGRCTASSLEYCEALVERHGIMLLPATVMDYGDEHFRIGLGRRNFGDVLGRWEKTLQ